MPLLKNKQMPTKTKIIDTLVNIAAVIHPLSALPQVYTIYVSQNVAGVSLWTWLGFMIIGFIFLAYGLAHRLKPIIVTQILWFIVDAMIIIGVLLYQ
jgi:uncharacterized protein with PQ loop repeat